MVILCVFHFRIMSPTVDNSAIEIGLEETDSLSRYKLYTHGELRSGVKVIGRLCTAECHLSISYELLEIKYVFHSVNFTLYCVFFCAISTNTLSVAIIGKQFQKFESS